MSIDDRLRTGMEPVGGLPSVAEPAFIGAVVAKAEHRHKVRRVAVLGCAAALILIAAVAIPTALSVDRSDDDPVNTPTPAPTTVTETWTFDPQTTPIDDDSWGTAAITRSQRLAPLDGTPLERYGSRAFRAAYPGWPEYHTPGSTCDCAPASLTLEFGTATLRSGLTGFGGAIHLDGTFKVKDDQVTFEFQGVGRSAFRWAIGREGRLSLTFLSAEPGSSIAGLPAEVMLRMLMTAAPFGG